MDCTDDIFNRLRFRLAPLPLCWDCYLRFLLFIGNSVHLATDSLEFRLKIAFGSASLF